MKVGRIIVMLLAVLLVQQAQCLAACAVETCEQNLPPCHRHHGDPSQDSSSDSSKNTAAKCLHDAVAPTAVQLVAVDVTPAAGAILPEYFVVTDRGAVATITASPPGPAFSILRV